MQHISPNSVSVVQFSNGLLAKQTQRLEPESKEESEIINLERKIAEQRRKGLPADSLLHERQRIYDSWIQRLDRELRDPKITEQDRENLEKQRERAIRDYSSG